MNRTAAVPELRTRPSLLFGLFFMILVAGACGPSDEARLRKLNSSLSPTVADLLVSGSDAELQRHYAEVGIYALKEHSWNFLTDLGEMSRPDREFVLPYLARLGRAAEEEFDIGSGTQRAEYFAGLSADALDTVLALSKNRRDLWADRTIADVEKLHRLQQLRESFIRWEDTANEAMALANIGELQAGLGQRDEAMAAFTDALRLSETIDGATMTCQFLGKLAFLHHENGNLQAADDCLDRIAHRAAKSRMPDQAVRTEEFRGSRAAAAGQLGAAHLHYLESRELCRRYKGGEYEYRPISTLLGFYGELECWNMYGRLVDEAEAIVPVSRRPHVGIGLVSIQVSGAIAQFKEGDEAGALETSARINDSVPRRPYRQVYAWARIAHARLLLWAGRLEESLQAIEVGIFDSLEDHNEGAVRIFRLLQVEVLEKLGRAEEAWARLDELRQDKGVTTDVLSNDARDMALLEVRLSRSLFGDGPELAAAVVKAFHVLRARLAAGPPSVLTYLDLQSFDEFRWLLHELVAHDPRLGYEFDMAWRGLTEVARRDVGLPEDALFADGEAAVRGWIEARGASVPVDAFAAQGTHLLYVVTESGILRWRRDGVRMERDVLDWDPALMRTTVSEVLAEISQPPADPDAMLPKATRAGLGVLVEKLIPADMRGRWSRSDGADPDQVWITADDALTQIPFATFDLDPQGDYRPLIEVADIGYLRFFRGVSDVDVDSKSESLVVGDPQIAPELQRRLGGLAALDGAREEAIAVGEAWRPGTVLLGAEATKANVVSKLEASGRIYVAAHHVRDPATPFIRFIPLAAGERTGDITEAVLEAADILPLDLRGCELVVLSGCASGAPYVDGSRVAPGLGEAFLDAGCGRVVQALWQVVDLEVPDLSVDSDEPGMEVSDRAGLHPFNWAFRRTVSVKTNKVAD